MNPENRMSTDPVPPADSFATQVRRTIDPIDADETRPELRAPQSRPNRQSAGPAKFSHHIRADGRIDDFEIIQRLGQGAFADVYLARQTSMSRLVALKISTGSGDEPQALAQFDHPNIVRVFDQRFVPQSDSSSANAPLHLLYMQYHPGGTLADVVDSVRATKNQDDEPLRGAVYLDAIDRNLLAAAQVVPDRSPTRAWLREADWPKLVAWVGIQIANALQAAHESGVLHRDVKPANILLTAEGIPQLADFNVSIAEVVDRSGGQAALGGSIGYMSPEHLRAMIPSTRNPVDSSASNDVREPADLYSLGVLLWELWQGQSPFDCSKKATSLTRLLKDQLESRQRPLILDQNQQNEPKGNEASARVLHRVLQSTLAMDPQSRPSSGAEMAGQLRLAMHPEAAKIFEPGERSIASRLMRVSPWWIATIAILVPNIAAALFNYLYNQNEIMDPDTRAVLDGNAFWVNLIAFPFAVSLMIHYTRASSAAIKAVARGDAAKQEQLRATLNLGHRAALIGGACWLIAGIVYPVMLTLQIDHFTLNQSIHFFFSMLMCGGVAMSYPLFALGMIATHAYYPQMIRRQMVDTHFEVNAVKMLRHAESYLLVAVSIPLLGLALMVFSEPQSKSFMMVAILAGFAGLFGSFAAYRSMVQTWNRLAEVLSPETTTS